MELPPVIVTTGTGLTVIVTLVSFEHAPLLTVTIYVVVLAGVAVTFAPVVALNPAAGVHEYVAPPPAVRLTGVPAQTVDEGLIVGTGVGFTVIVILSFTLHELLLTLTV